MSSCNLCLSEPQENELTEEDLQSMYSQPHKRKKIDTSENIEDCLGERTDKNHKSELFGDSYHDTNTMVSSNESEKDDAHLNSAKLPEVPRVINPFAKQPEKDGVSNTHFSDIRRLCRIRKTMIDSSTVVQSR